MQTSKKALQIDFSQKAKSLNKLNIFEFAFLMADLLDKDLSYAVERIILSNKSIINEDLDSIIFKINQLENLSLKDLIDTVLIEEYKYLLPSIKQCKYVSLQSINVNDIIVQKCYFDKVKEVDFYNQDYHKPRGIYLKHEDKYRLIDGHHRLKSAKLANLKEIEGYVYE